MSESIILNRGETHKFQAQFLDDGGSPLTPLSSSYPSFSITDINGSLVVSGVGTLTTNGNYHTDFLVSSDAVLSTVNLSWNIKWVFVSDDNGQQIEINQNFGVSDQTKPQVKGQSAEQSFLTLANKPYRAMYVSETDVAELDLEITNVLDDSLILFSVLDKSDFIKTTDETGAFVFYIDVPNNLIPGSDKDYFNQGDYLLTWGYRETSSSSMDFSIQRLSAVSRLIYKVIPSMRMFVDKLKKSMENNIYSYSDSEIWNGMQQGLNLLNSHYPRSRFNITSVPQELGTYLIYYSAVHLLMQQQILDTELAFDATGQTTSLSLQIEYDGPISRLVELINERLTQIKYEILRQSNPVGVAGLRLQSYRHYGSFVFKIKDGNSLNFTQALLNLGLLV